jgi:hypothetical protein
MLLERLVSESSDGLHQPSARELDVVARVVEGRESAEAFTWREALAALLPSVQPLAWAAVLALVVGVVVWQRQPPDDEWAVRSTSSDSLAIRAFCVLSDVQGEPIIRSLSADPGPQEVDACPDTGALRFAYLSDAPGYLVAFEVRPDGELLRVLPDRPDASPLRLVVAQRLRALSLELGAAALRGRDGIELLFVRTAEPLPPDEVERLAVEPGELQGDGGAAVRYRIPIERTEP